MGQELKKKALRQGFDLQLSTIVIDDEAYVIIISDKVDLKNSDLCAILILPATVCIRSASAVV